jgi:hypothetical protein
VYVVCLFFFFFFFFFDVHLYSTKKWHAGQIVEAAAICAVIRQNYPRAVDAYANFINSVETNYKKLKKIVYAMNYQPDWLMFFAEDKTSAYYRNSKSDPHLDCILVKTMLYAPIHTMIALLIDVPYATEWIPGLQDAVYCSQRHESNPLSIDAKYEMCLPLPSRIVHQRDACVRINVFDCIDTKEFPSPFLCVTVCDAVGGPETSPSKQSVKRIRVQNLSTRLEPLENSYVQVTVSLRVDVGMRYVPHSIIRKTAAAYIVQALKRLEHKANENVKLAVMTVSQYPETAAVLNNIGMKLRKLEFTRT